MKIFSSVIAVCGLMAASFANAALDDDAAQAVLKKNACLTCHAVDKKKVGPSFTEVAKKYKGKADAEDKLVKHLSAKHMVELDGKKIEHPAIKSGDAVEIKNIVEWILKR